MKTKKYVFTYTRLDGSQFEVFNTFASDELAVDSAKFALSKHADLLGCSVYEAIEVETIKKQYT